MSFLKESPRDARSTTAAQIRARVSRTLSMALAVALTAILLPAAISLAKTGHFGRIPVVDVITGAATETSTSTQHQQDTQGPRQHAPAAQLPAPASDNAEAALAQAGLPKLKDDRSVAARLSSGSHKTDNSAADSQGK